MKCWRRSCGTVITIGESELPDAKILAEGFLNQLQPHVKYGFGCLNVGMKFRLAKMGLPGRNCSSADYLLLGGFLLVAAAEGKARIFAIGGRAFDDAELDGLVEGGMDAREKRACFFLLPARRRSRILFPRGADWKTLRLCCCLRACAPPAFG